MPNNKYKLRYLPIFFEDLKGKENYIAFEKLNPDAALRLVDEGEEHKTMEVRRLLYVGRDRDRMV